MSFPCGSRIRYRDQIDHPGIGVIEDYFLSDSGEEHMYKVHWNDYGLRIQTARFIEAEFEVY